MKFIVIQFALGVCLYLLTPLYADDQSTDPAAHLPENSDSTSPSAPLPTNLELPPPQHPLDRYSIIWETSPFVIVTDLSGQNDELTGRYVITGFFQVGGRDVVLFFDRTTLERFALSPGEQRSGLTLQSLQHQGDLNGLQVVLNQGGMGTELRYDPQAVPAAGAGQPHASITHNQQMPPGLPAPPPTGQNAPGQAMVGQPTINSGEPPAPRRIIRRRNIVAPE